MNKKKSLVCIGVCICVALIVIAGIIIFQDENQTGEKLVTIAEVKHAFASDMQTLKEGAYENLIAMDFDASIEDIENIYNLEILTDTSYQSRTFLENFEIMNQAIDKFFGEKIDKTFIEAEIQMSKTESVYVSYNDIERVCADEKYNNNMLDYLFGNNTSEGGYMVQTSESLLNTWFSRNAFDNIMPSGECKMIYSYLSGVRQIEDTVIHLQDGDINLSEMESKVLDFLNTDKFPLSISDGISYGIGEVRVLENDGICFKVRRIYKGVPFEYGSTGSSGLYIDTLDHESGEICYATREYPDTMVGFSRVNGTVVERQEIFEMITAGTALEVLSQQIGENSVYEVYGVELVYRNCEIPEEQKNELDDILTPKWKIITINQNDDKYTLFYVDVVTCEITERFEYYYE